MSVSSLDVVLSESSPPQARARGPWSVVKDYLALTKPRLSSLVLFTTAGSMWLSGRPVSGWTWLCALAGTAGTVGAAHTFNCVLERDSDRFMARTAQRPLPTRRLTVPQALVFGVVLAGLALPALSLGVNWLTGLLGLCALLLYVLAYTPLKPRTHLAMLVGAIPGALPPLMGWTATTGRVALPGLVLFGILFFWQLAHFIAIALFRKAEYRAAGLTSLPLQKGDDVARLHAVLYLAALLPVSVLPAVVGVAGWLYAVVAVALGAWFAWVGVAGWRTRGDEAWARKFFRVSLLYLTGLFAALAISGGLGL
ncbi:MAG: protoheme IX farnesyltransferase [Myxococcaceae bacterium]